MKILCDVCSKNKAYVFCSADEAALCDECDTRVHHANKLASKHQRFSLLQPSSSHVPLCDICQEKKAMLFCQQDRAILCVDCDVSVHTANELTLKHDRFLLTGFSLSMSCSESVTDLRSHNFKAKSAVSGGGSTSSISEYLIEITPEWQVEDLLDSFPKDTDLDINRTAYNYENMGLWVPQAPAFLQPTTYSSGTYEVNALEGEDMGPRMKLDVGFTVPEISQQSTSSKKNRAFLRIRN